MEIYIIVLVLFFFFSISEPFLRKTNSVDQTFFWMLFVILWLLAGLRYDVGVDYMTYRDIYESSGDIREMLEIGFVGIIKLFNLLELPFSVFTTCYSFLTILLVFHFIRKYSPYLYLSVFIYYAIGNYYFSSFNSMRQSLATAIFMNCLPLVSNKKFWKYLLVLLTTSFCVHFSSLILIPLYFVLNRKLSLFFKLSVIIFTICFGASAITIIEISPYAVYLTFEKFASEVPLTYYLIGLIALIVFVYGLLHPEWERQYWILSNVNFVVILLLCLIFQYENTPLVMVFNRLLYFFTLIYIVVLPLLYAEMRISSNRKIFIIITSCLFGILSYVALVQNVERSNMVPYKTIFNQ